MKKLTLIIFSLLLISQKQVAQNIIQGVTSDENTNSIIEYVNIGIVGKDVGTVSDSQGHFSIEIGSEYDQDSILFSSIGYEAKLFPVKDLKAKADNVISLKPHIYELTNIEITYGLMKEKILGNKFKGVNIQAGFEKNLKGFECGVLYKIKKRAVLKELTCNIANCTFDSVHYRLNVYKEIDKNSFENILQKPILVKQKIESAKTTLTVDLSAYNIIVEGNSLVTLEHIEDMGEGKLTFSGGFLKGSDCYYRKTSQGNWTKSHVKIGFSVVAKVEE